MSFSAVICEAFRRLPDGEVVHEQRPCIAADNFDAVDFLDNHASDLFGPLAVSTLGQCLIGEEWKRCIRFQMPTDPQKLSDIGGMLAKELEIVQSAFVDRCDASNDAERMQDDSRGEP